MEERFTQSSIRAGNLIGEARAVAGRLVITAGSLAPLNDSLGRDLVGAAGEVEHPYIEAGTNVELFGA
jgi:hypothetical protein